MNYLQLQIMCRRCGGSGKLTDGTDCQQCFGFGHREVVTLLPDLQHGDTIMLEVQHQPDYYDVLPPTRTVVASGPINIDDDRMAWLHQAGCQCLKRGDDLPMSDGAD